MTLPGISFWGGCRAPGIACIGERIQREYHPDTAKEPREDVTKVAT